MFNIPIVLFIFKRAKKSTIIIDQLAKIAPTKLYLIADGPRSEEETEQVEACRSEVEKHITWPCEIIKNYAPQNRGVFENIAGGAKWVFEREESAIFLEDDNFPSLSFFPFCEEMLERYKNNDRIIWICGSNYLIESEFEDKASYSFTQNMLPCGWASWRDKFMKYYQADFELWEKPEIRARIKRLPYSNALKRQEMYNWESEIYRKKTTGKYLSWDYQMSFTLRSQNLIGIVPKYNQIMNIGVDIDSIHGGISLDNEMTRRFCENPIKDLEFPLLHPKTIEINNDLEKRLGRIITNPLKKRIVKYVSDILKQVLGISQHESLTQKLKFRK